MAVVAVGIMVTAPVTVEFGLWTIPLCELALAVTPVVTGDLKAREGAAGGRTRPCMLRAGPLASVQVKGRSGR